MNMFARHASTSSSARYVPTLTAMDKNKKALKELQAAYERLARERRRENNQFRHEREQQMHDNMRKRFGSR